jgi:hypothetical protein
MAAASLPHKHACTPRQADLVRWAARLGAVTPDALCQRQGISLASAAGRLFAAERAGLLAHSRPLAGRPTLYTATRAGMRAAGVRGVDPARVSPANALHLIECARVAATLELRYPDHRVGGERDLRREEHRHSGPLASALLGSDPRGRPLYHRPDLVLWPVGDPGLLPVAVEVELTVKASARLEAICRAWARTRYVAGIVYFASAEVERPLLRALSRVGASPRIAVVPLAVLPVGG